MQDRRLAVVGAGLVGRRHMDAIAQARGVTLSAIVEPGPEGPAIAAAAGVPHFAALDALLESGLADGLILATPNQLHVSGGLAAIEAGLPVLIEKPLASDTSGARALVEAAEAAGVALAVGHHRRHNPLVARAKAVIEEGRLGRLVAVQGAVWLMKPDDYFAAAPWRQQPGAGPVFINLIHDVDILQYLCGPVVEVQAMEANAIRGFAVEDTAALILRFASGALGTLTLSDTAAAPWSWELTAAENPAYPVTGQACTWITGTHGALSLPDLAVWSHPEARSWWAPIEAVRETVAPVDALILQAEQFGAVIRGEARPLVTGRDGLAALRVIEAVKSAAQSGALVRLDPQ